MQYLIGVDLGTTATKAVLFEKNGKIVASSSQAYPLYRDASGMAEESLEEIFEAVLEIYICLFRSGLCLDIPFEGYGSADLEDFLQVAFFRSRTARTQCSCHRNPPLQLRQYWYM